jgi:hypothetical protein
VEQATDDRRIQNDLERRHRLAAGVVGAFLILTLSLVVVSLVGGNSLLRPGDPNLAMVLWVAILIFGLGAVVLRRTRFSAMRLQDIASLHGMDGLLGTLQRTTIQVACLAGAAALTGFAVTIMTGGREFTLYAALVAVAVLLYDYPSRNAWKRLVHGIVSEGVANDPHGKLSGKGLV